MIVLVLIGAGWVSGLVSTLVASLFYSSIHTSVWDVIPGSGAGPFGSLIVTTIGSAAIGALFLKPLLRLCTGMNVSFAVAFVALFAGGLIGLAATVISASATRVTTPGTLASPLLLLTPLIVIAVLAVQVMLLRTLATAPGSYTTTPRDHTRRDYAGTEQRRSPLLAWTLLVLLAIALAAGFRDFQHHQSRKAPNQPAASAGDTREISQQMATVVTDYNIGVEHPKRFRNISCTKIAAGTNSPTLYSGDQVYDTYSCRTTYANARPQIWCVQALNGQRVSDYASTTGCRTTSTKP